MTSSKAIANFPWYDWEETRAANDLLYRAVFAALPSRLQRRWTQALRRDVPPSNAWTHPHLGVSQACNYNVAVDFAAHLRAVAVPVFDRDAVADLGATFGPGEYQSVVVVHRAAPLEMVGDLKGATVSINAANSHSGHLSLARLLAEGRSDDDVRSMVTAVKTSGSHRQSAKWVAEGTADVAALDIICFELLRRHSPRIASALKVVALTAPALAPPFVTAAHTDADDCHAIEVALLKAFAAVDTKAARATLVVNGARLVEASEIASVASAASGAPRLTSSVPRSTGIGQNRGTVHT